MSGRLTVNKIVGGLALTWIIMVANNRYSSRVLRQQVAEKIESGEIVPRHRPTLAEAREAAANRRRPE